MKKAEENAKLGGTTEITLMENAGKSATEIIIKTVPESIQTKTCVILCGSGNNGGDGFVVARLLQNVTKKVVIILADSIPKTKDATVNYEKCKDIGIEIFDAQFDLQRAIIEISKANIIVDAVYGIGFHGSLPEKVAEILSSANDANAFRFSLDIPSGADANTGDADKNTFSADVTISFGATKLGTLLYPCKTYCGEIKVADIGLFESAFDNIGAVLLSITENQMPHILPERKPDSHKGTYGKLLIIAGSKNMSGAAALSVLSALKSGVGICTLASTKTVIDRVASNIYEPTYITLPENNVGGISADAVSILEKEIDKYDAVCFGMGVGNTADTKTLLANILNCARKTLIIDADGINALSSCIDLCKDTTAKIILTPHVGEMSRLTGKTILEINENRINIANDFVKENFVTLVLKGANTIVASANETYINTTGNCGLSTGGSGDVLTGIIGSLSAQGLNPLTSCLAGVFLHGKAADVATENIGKASLLPTDVINTLPLLFKKYGK